MSSAGAVDVAPAAEHVVEPTGADVVGPAVATDDHTDGRSGVGMQLQELHRVRG